MTTCVGYEHTKAHTGLQPLSLSQVPVICFRVLGSSQLISIPSPPNLFQLQSFPAPVFILLITLLFQLCSPLVLSLGPPSVFLSHSSPHHSTHGQYSLLAIFRLLLSLFALDSRRCLWLYFPSHLQLKTLCSTLP